MSISVAEITTYEQLLTAFSANKSWDAQYRLIIKLGKTLPALDEKLKTEAHQVAGCESLAWLVITESNGRYDLQMDSDTRVVKGLMKIICIIFNAKTVQQVAEMDCQDLFAQLGLLNHLSPSRSNGLSAIINAIQSPENRAQVDEK